MSYCSNCGSSINESNKFCSVCGEKNSSHMIQPLVHHSEGYEKQSANDIPFQESPYRNSLPKYYNQEFDMIQQSNETYKGKFNGAAFLGGPLWALYRGLYLPAIVAIVIGILTAGVGSVIYWFVFAGRGNWMLYNLHKKNKQILF